MNTVAINSSNVDKSRTSSASPSSSDQWAYLNLLSVVFERPLEDVLSSVASDRAEARESLAA